MPVMNERILFEQALDHPEPGQRSAYLGATCGDDSALRRRVESLLRSHDRAGQFLNHTVPQRLSEELVTGTGLGDTPQQSLSEAATRDALGLLATSDYPGALGRLDHYEVLEVLGHGGMGVVLRALDTKLHRAVAIKVMAPALAATAAARQRFTREAQAAAAVRDDHVIAIYAVEEANGLPYLVMEYVSGPSLQKRLDQAGPLGVTEILRIGGQTASGLAAAHAQGLVHRDVKPANILLENGVERVKITDFGLARAVDDDSLTQSGAVAGTPQYMAPEQAAGEPVDHRADLFSLGSVLYAACTGRPPFCGGGTMAVLKRVCEEAPRPIRETNPEFPEWLVAVIAKLHAKSTADRFQSAAEVAELLGRQLAYVQEPAFVPRPAGPLPTVAPRRRWVPAAVLILLLFVGGLGATEASGMTRLVATVIRVLTPDGMLVVEVDDPAVEVTVEGDGGLVITGAGPHVVRLRPGSYRLLATKDGKPITDDVVTISRGDKRVVIVSVKAPSRAAPTHEIRRFLGHTGEVMSVAFTPDDRRVVSASADSSVRVWDAETGKELKRFEGHTHCVYSAAILPDGQRVLSGSGWGPGRGEEGDAKWSVCLWELESGREIHRWEGRGGPITSVALSSDGRSALIANGAGVVTLWDVGEWKEVKRFSLPKGLRSVRFSPDQRKGLVAGGNHGTPILRLLDLGSGRDQGSFEGHADHIWQAIYSPDGSRILSAGFDGTIRLWNAVTRDELRRFRGEVPAQALAFSADGRFVLAGNHPKGAMIRWLNVDTSADVLVLKGHADTGHNYWVRCVALSHDERRALSGAFDNTVRLWHLTPLDSATLPKGN
jgi:WD40 repeat protein